jgi:hypothetical protein
MARYWAMIVIFGIAFGMSAMKLQAAQIAGAGNNKEAQHSTTILRIFRAIEEREDTKIPDVRSLTYLAALA